MNASASSRSLTITPRRRSSSEISGIESVDTPTACKWRRSGRISEPTESSPSAAGSSPTTPTLVYWSVVHRGYPEVGPTAQAAGALHTVRLPESPSEQGERLSTVGASCSQSS